MDSDGYLSHTVTFPCYFLLCMGQSLCSQASPFLSYYTLVKSYLKHYLSPELQNETESLLKYFYQFLVQVTNFSPSNS